MAEDQLKKSTVFDSKNRVGIILAAIVAIGIAAALCYVAFFGVTRADYSLASERTNRAITTFNAAQNNIAAYRNAAVDPATTTGELEAAAKAYSASQSDYAAAVTALSGMRALKNDTIQTVYSAFIAKNTTFIEQSSSLASVLTDVHKKGTICSESAIGRMDTGDLSKVVAAYDTATAPCIAVMKSLGASNNTQAKAVAKKALDYFAAMRDHAVAMQAAYKAKNRAKFESEYKAFLAKADDFDTDTDTSSITDLANLASPAKELNTLMASIQAALK